MIDSTRSELGKYKAKISGNRIKAVKKIKLEDAKYLKGITLFNKQKKILITDSWNSLMHVYDLNGNQTNPINLDSCLKELSGMCAATRKDGNEEIYIYDCTAKTVFVFLLLERN